MIHNKNETNKTYTIKYESDYERAKIIFFLVEERSKVE
jgi:hypothetical protein